MVAAAMTAAFEIQTVCECEALLEAHLDANRQVLAGFASAAGSGSIGERRRESAPANSVGASGDRFDVVWQCPLCGRNTLRTFHVGGLTKVQSNKSSTG